MIAGLVQRTSLTPKQRFLFSNPKRSNRVLDGSPWISYYAGFSSKFVFDAFKNFALDIDTTVLDMWNGSGTTTVSAAMSGIPSIGVDLNPAMKIVARSREGNAADYAEVADRLSWLASGDQIFKLAANDFIEEDSLALWFSPRSAKILRAILNYMNPWLDEDREGTSAKSALATVACFRLTRALVSGFRTSNPTWIKTSKKDSELIDLNMTDVCLLLGELTTVYHKKMHEAILPDGFVASKLIIASSEELPLNNNSVSLVLSSPPYCTRIDYAVALRPELAVLGLAHGDAFKTLRRGMLGTTTVSPQTHSALESWGAECVSLLDKVERHATKASSGYYLKNLSQYFEGLFRSLREIARVLHSSGNVALIVQDSVYKDLRIDLAKIVGQMSENIGLSLVHKQEFAAGTTMRSINTRSRQYGMPGKVTETVLVFECT